MKWLIFLLIFTLPASAEELKMVRVHVTEPTQMKSIASLKLDVVASNRKEGWLDVIVDEKELTQIKALGLNTEVVIPDLEKHWQEMFKGKRDFGPYYTYSEMIAKLDSLHEAYPFITTEKESIGTSWEGRTIWAMKVSDNPKIDENEPAILYDGVHHAREPIGCTIVLDLIEYLGSNYGVDSEATYLVDNRELWFIPVLNPDGYVYNEDNPTGMWRKNKRDNNNNDVFDSNYDGVDPNRNYSYMWGYDDWGSSYYPGSETYRGPSPGSEPEIQAIMDLCRREKFAVALNYHSYGNWILYPWGYDEIYTPDSLIFREMGREMSSYNGYEPGTGWELLYLTNGDADDWMYGDTTKSKIFSFTIEVGEAFWQPDTAVIREQWDENLGMNLYVARVAEKLYEAWISLIDYEIDDFIGNENGELDPGETADLIITLGNIGTIEAIDLAAILTEHDPYISVSDSTSSFGNIPADSIVKNSDDPFTVVVDSICPMGHQIGFLLYLNGVDFVDTLHLYYTVKGIGTPGNILFYNDDYYGDEYSHDAVRAVYPYVDYWDGEDWGAPGSSVIDFYTTGLGKNIIIWNSWLGETFAEDTSSIAQFLDAGGNLWMSGQDILYGITSNWGNWNASTASFIYDYLHAVSGVDDPGIAPYDSCVTLYGMEGDPISGSFTDGILICPYVSEGIYNFTGSIEELREDAIPIFFYERGEIAGYRYEGDYKLVFSYWPFAYINDPNDPTKSDTTAQNTLARNILNWFSAAGIEEETTTPASMVYFLSQNVPNPVTSITTISYTLPQTSEVSLKVYDVTGRLVKTLVDAKMEAGTHTLVWNLKDAFDTRVTSGVYFYRLKTDNFTSTRKAIILK